MAPTGRAYAVDIDAAALDRLRQRSASEQISNIEVILGEANDPKLPAGEIDAVLIRNAYHEMPEHQLVLAGVARALRPGGTLVIIEAIHDENRSKPREQQIKGTRDCLNRLASLRHARPYGRCRSAHDAR